MNALEGARRHKCRLCLGQIVFAITMSSPKTRGGKPMPLNPEPDEAGNVACRRTSSTRIVARVLAKDDTLDVTTETRAMPHFATCPGKGSNIAKAAEAFLADQANSTAGDQ